MLNKINSKIFTEIKFKNMILYKVVQNTFKKNLSIKCGTF